MPKHYTILQSTELTVPDEAVPVYYEGSAAIRGFQLPDGTVIKPQFVLEQHMEDDDSVMQDLTYTEAGTLGFDYDLDAPEILPNQRLLGPLMNLPAQP